MVDWFVALLMALFVAGLFSLLLSALVGLWFSLSNRNRYKSDE